MDALLKQHRGSLACGVWLEDREKSTKNGVDGRRSAPSVIFRNGEGAAARAKRRQRSTRAGWAEQRADEDQNSGGSSDRPCHGQGQGWAARPRSPARRISHF